MNIENKLLEISQTKFEIISSNNNLNNNMKNYIQEEIKLLIKKYKNISIKSENVNLDEENFKQKIKDGYNYPIYPNDKEGKNLLIYIRKYLIMKKNNIKKIYIQNLYTTLMEILKHKKNIFVILPIIIA